MNKRIKNPMIYEEWILNWEFPFVHKVTYKYTIKTIHKLMNVVWDEYIKEARKKS